MKVDKYRIKTQRAIIVQKLKEWDLVRMDRVPPSGWIKAVRGALGMTTSQLGKLMGVNQATALRYEQREIDGKVTIDTLRRAADAMKCKLVYAIVPSEEYPDLESIVRENAKSLALKVLNKTEHTMKLEKQGTGKSNQELEKLIEEIINDVDSRIWDKDI